MHAYMHLAFKELSYPYYVVYIYFILHASQNKRTVNCLQSLHSFWSLSMQKALPSGAYMYGGKGGFQRSPIPHGWVGGVPPSRTLPGEVGEPPLLAAALYIPFLRHCIGCEEKTSLQGHPPYIVHV